MTNEKYIKDFRLKLLKENLSANLEMLINQQLTSHPSGREYNDAIDGMIAEEVNIENILSGFDITYLKGLINRSKTRRPQDFAHDSTIKDLIAAYAIWMFTVANVETVRNPDNFSSDSAKPLAYNNPSLVYSYRGEMKELPDESPYKKFARIRHKIPTKMWYQISNHIVSTLASMPHPWGQQVVFRGMKLPLEAVKALKAGENFNMMRIGSWSTDGEMAESYALRYDRNSLKNWKPVLFHGLTKIGAPVDMFSGFRLENEVVVGGGQMKILKIDSDDDITVVQIRIEQGTQLQQEVLPKWARQAGATAALGAALGGGIGAGAASSLVGDRGITPRVEQPVDTTQSVEDEGPEATRKMPTDGTFDWSMSPDPTMIWISPDQIPDDYILPSSGKTAGEWRHELMNKKMKRGGNTWDIDDLKRVLFSNAAAWGYSTSKNVIAFDRHPDHGYRMLPPKWSLAYEVYEKKIGIERMEAVLQKSDQEQAQIAQNLDLTVEELRKKLQLALSKLRGAE